MSNLFNFKKAKEAGYSNEEILEFLSQRYPSFCKGVQRAKDLGYTSEEVVTYLAKKEETGSIDWSFYEKPYVTEIMEVSWSERVEDLSRNHPTFFWSFITITVLFVAWISILYVWKLVKLMLYQTVYTIAKAIQDGNSINSCKREK